MNKAQKPSSDGVSVETAKEVDVRRTSNFSDEQLAGIGTWDELAKLLGENGVASADIADFGTGFSLLSDKTRLVGVPFAILDWRFNPGDFGDFVSMTVLTKSGEKWIVNDGSTGICEQMRGVDKRLGGKPTVLRVEKGLHKSEYSTMIWDSKKGEDVETSATTFYLRLEKAQ